MKFLCLTTCYNRREITLAALRSMTKQRRGRDWELDIAMLDDGSTDGTSKYIQSQFPSVKVFQGSGNLYWAGGMRYLFSRILHYLSNYDGIIVFNDDIILLDHALEAFVADIRKTRLNGECRTIVSGLFRSDISGEITYGGLMLGGFLNPLRLRRVSVTPLNGLPQKVDTINMNFTFIPSSVINEIGFLDEKFIHHSADIEFGIRARSLGYDVVTTSTVIGICERNTVAGTALEPNIGPIECARRLVSIKEQPITQRYYFVSRWGGPLWPLVFLSPYVKAMARSLFSMSLRTRKP